ncbi:hypothetical protein BH23GEM3_BH23GEM3_05820 [soil metagenome]|nr:hypothetical protein [Gemmatimonadota bacterium]
MDWQKLLPWFAIAGGVLGYVTGDNVLLFMAILLFLGWIFWRSRPREDED